VLLTPLLSEQVVQVLLAVPLMETMAVILYLVQLLQPVVAAAVTAFHQKLLEIAAVLVVAVAAVTMVVALAGQAHQVKETQEEMLLLMQQPQTEPVVEEQEPLVLITVVAGLYMAVLEALDLQIQLAVLLFIMLEAVVVGVAVLL
jgi:hypothetical protein